METKEIPIGVVATEAAPSGVSLPLLLTIGVGAYVAGKFTKNHSESPLPSLGTLAMTYVVFRALDALWPLAANTVTRTTLPGTVGGISQAFKAQMGNFFAPQPFRGSISAPSRQTVESYTVK